MAGWALNFIIISSILETVGFVVALLSRVREMALGRDHGSLFNS